MLDSARPEGFVDDDEDVPEHEAPDWDQWVADLEAAKGAFS